MSMLSSSVFELGLVSFCLESFDLDLEPYDFCSESFDLHFASVGCDVVPSDVDVESLDIDVEPLRPLFLKNRRRLGGLRFRL